MLYRRRKLLAELLPAKCEEAAVGAAVLALAATRKAVSAGRRTEAAE